MNLSEVITTRRTTKEFEDKAVPREIIEQCLSVAVWAPNHKLTEPWHFTIVTGQKRARLGEALAAGLIEEHPTNPVFRLKAQSERIKPLSAPTIVTIFSERGTDEVREWENFAAVSAATQNFLLCLHDLGLAAIWRTGPSYQTKMAYEFLQIPDTFRFVGAIFLGYPKGPTKNVRTRQPLATKTTWILDPED